MQRVRVPEGHAEHRDLKCLLAVYVVFGAAGGIGSALVQRLSGQQGAKVIQVRN
jgi:NADP-dependent 3-hydroxy acid dehydrogenase YdfG